MPAAFCRSASLANRPATASTTPYRVNRPPISTRRSNSLAPADEATEPPVDPELGVGGASRQTS